MSNPDLNNLQTIREVIDTHELRAKKSLGQNFLLDLNVTDKIANVGVNLDKTTVFEIGPGPGGLTRSLLSAGAKKLHALEFDTRAISALQGLKNASDGKLEIHQADALNTNLKDICSDEPAAIIANLPYNIATPLLFNWLEQIYENPNSYSQLILMFQKEVAERIVAKPNSKQCGRLTVMSQWLCHTTKVFDLPPSVFSPPPKVTSSIVQLIPKKLSSDDKPAFKDMEKIVKMAFGQRRKMIRSTLKPYVSICEKYDIKTTLRAEDLTIEQFSQIAQG